MLHIYWADISNISADYDLTLFSEYRKHRLENIKLMQKRKQSIGAELLLIYALRQSIPNVSLPLSIKCGECGKPVFNELPLHFSLSHSAEYAACALSNVPVGIDLEFGMKNNDKLADRYFLRHERESINKATDMDFAFAKIWTAKESALKLNGAGLSKGLLSAAVYEDCVIMEPGCQRFDVKWLKKENLCMAVCTEMPETKIHVKKINL